MLGVWLVNRPRSGISPEGIGGVFDCFLTGVVGPGPRCCQRNSQPRQFPKNAVELLRSTRPGAEVRRKNSFIGRVEASEFDLRIHADGSLGCGRCESVVSVEGAGFAAVQAVEGVVVGGVEDVGGIES